MAQNVVATSDGVVDGTPKATKESLEWFCEARDKWQSVSRTRIKPLRPMTPFSQITELPTMMMIQPPCTTAPPNQKDLSSRETENKIDKGSLHTQTSALRLSSSSMGIVPSAESSEQSIFGGSPDPVRTLKGIGSGSSVQELLPACFRPDSKSPFLFSSPVGEKGNPPFTSKPAIETKGSIFSSGSAWKNIDATPTTESQSHRERLVSFYTKHNPSKLDSVDQTLAKYKEKEEELFAKLTTKYATYPKPDGTGPRVFLQFSTGEVVIQLFVNQTPTAAENFRALCTGEKGMGRSGKLLCYKKSLLHRIVPGMCVQGGDFTVGDGTGGESIYAPNSRTSNGMAVDIWGSFQDEQFLAHSHEGLLSMANNRKDGNNSQFFITLGATPHLNGKHVVFGKVVSGMGTIHEIARTPTNQKQCPLNPVQILDCGEIQVPKPGDVESAVDFLASDKSTQNKHRGGSDSTGTNGACGVSKATVGGSSSITSSFDNTKPSCPSCDVADRASSAATSQSTSKTNFSSQFSSSIPTKPLHSEAFQGDMDEPAKEELKPSNMAIPSTATFGTGSHDSVTNELSTKVLNPFTAFGSSIKVTKPFVASASYGGPMQRPFQFVQSDDNKLVQSASSNLFASFSAPKKQPSLPQSSSIAENADSLFSPPSIQSSASTSFAAFTASIQPASVVGGLQSLSNMEASNSATESQHQSDATEPDPSRSTAVVEESSSTSQSSSDDSDESFGPSPCKPSTSTVVFSGRDIVGEDDTGGFDLPLADRVPTSFVLTPERRASKHANKYSTSSRCSADTEESDAINHSVATQESSVAEQIETLARDIDESEEQLQAVDSKLEEQRELLESRQASARKALQNMSRSLLPPRSPERGQTSTQPKANKCQDRMKAPSRGPLAEAAAKPSNIFAKQAGTSDIGSVSLPAQNTEKVLGSGVAKTRLPSETFSYG